MLLINRKGCPKTKRAAFSSFVQTHRIKLKLYQSDNRISPINSSSLAQTEFYTPIFFTVFPLMKQPFKSGGLWY
jgi:hypothetical protein